MIAQPHQHYRLNRRRLMRPSHVVNNHHRKHQMNPTPKSFWLHLHSCSSKKFKLNDAYHHHHQPYRPKIHVLDHCAQYRVALYRFVKQSYHIFSIHVKIFIATVVGICCVRFIITSKKKMHVVLYLQFLPCVITLVAFRHQVTVPFA